MGKRQTVGALLLASCTPMAALAEGVHTYVTAYYPGVSWHLRYDLEGVLEEYNNHKVGQSTYATARSQTSGLLVSVQVAGADGAKTAAQCREREHQHNRQQQALADAEIRLSDAGGVDMEVLVRLGTDKKTLSRHVHRFWHRDGACAKVHVSKTPFAESDRAGFDNFLRSVRFEPATPVFERGFLIQGRGTLVVTTPAAWGFRTSKPGQLARRDIQFMDPGGDYQLMITLFPEAQKMLKGEPTPKAFVETARDAVKSQSVEPEPQVLELKGKHGTGFYFLTTDRTLVDKPARPNDWKHLRQGALPMGESLLFFSLFSNAKEGPVVDGALRSMSEARLVPSP